MKRNLIAISILINFLISCIPANGQNDSSGYGWIDESLEIETSINNENRNNFYQLYYDSIISPLRSGEVIKFNVGRFMNADRFFRSDYCYQIGEYVLSGSINLPTWCNRFSGPLSDTKYSPSVLIVPITVSLEHNFVKEMFYLLEDSLSNVDSIGVVKHRKYDINQLVDSSFSTSYDQLIGIVDEKLTRMQLFRVNGASKTKSSKFSNEFKNYSATEGFIHITAIGDMGKHLGGLNIRRNGIDCIGHANCIKKNLKHLEFVSNDYAPKLMNSKRWGPITTKITPPYFLMEEQGAWKAIYLSRNFLMVLDLEGSIRNSLRGIRIGFKESN